MPEPKRTAAEGFWRALKLGAGRLASGDLEGTELGRSKDAAINLAKDAGVVAGKVKEGYQEIDKSLGFPVSTSEQENANREQFADSPITGGYKGAVADLAENPSITNAMGVPLAALGMTGKAAGQAAKAAGAGEGGQLTAEIVGDPLNYAGMAPVALTKLNKINMIQDLVKLAKAGDASALAKLSEAAKMGDVGANAAIKSDEMLRAASVAAEASAPVSTGGSIRRRYKAPEAPVNPQIKESLANRFTPTEPLPDTNIKSNLDSRFGGQRPGEVITAPAEPLPAQAPSPALEAAPSPTPVITQAEAAPAPSPVATPSIAEETAGLEAKPSFWDRNKGKVKGGAIGAGLVGGASVAYNMGQTKGKQDMANAAPPPVTPSAPIPQEPAIPPAAPVAAHPDKETPSEQDIYDSETGEIQGSAIDNLNASANAIPTAREQPESPQVVADRMRIQQAQNQVDEASQMQPEGYNGGSTLGLALASIGGALNGQTDLPLRISDRLRQGQRDSVTDLQRSAASRLTGAQAGLEATLAGKREQAARGNERVGDVKSVAELRNAANELGMKIQAEKDPRKRQMMKSQLDLLQSEIAKNKGAASYYASGAKENLDRAKAEGMQIENERQRSMNELLKQKTKSPNRPSASK